MSLSPIALRALLDAGATAEMIVCAIEAEAAADEVRKAALREGNLERQRRKRERDKLQMSRDVTRDSALHGVTENGSPPRPLSPQTPLTPTPPPGDISTRAREATAKLVEGKLAFDQFWAIYPRKVGKPKAASLFLRVTRSTPVADIIAGLERQLEGWALRPPDLVPHPTTWLGRDGWNDEPEKPRPTLVASNERPNPSEKFQRKQQNLANSQLGFELSAEIRRQRGGD